MRTSLDEVKRLSIRYIHSSAYRGRGRVTVTCMAELFFARIVERCPILVMKPYRGVDSIQRNTEARRENFGWWLGAGRLTGGLWEVFQQSTGSRLLSWANHYVENFEDDVARFVTGSIQ